MGATGSEWVAKLDLAQPVTDEDRRPATGSEFSVIRADNATGNFTKVAQRLPVRIVIDPGQPLADRLSPGMSVVVSIDTAAAVPAGEERRAVAQD